MQVALYWLGAWKHLPQPYAALGDSALSEAHLKQPAMSLAVRRCNLHIRDRKKAAAVGVGAGTRACPVLHRHVQELFTGSSNWTAHTCTAQQVSLPCACAFAKKRGGSCRSYSTSNALNQQSPQVQGLHGTLQPKPDGELASESHLQLHVTHVVGRRSSTAHTASSPSLACQQQQHSRSMRLLQSHSAPLGRCMSSSHCSCWRCCSC
jgi:hypothetical protein